jgi:hypothetical protein
MPESASGFTIRTGCGEVIDYGTEFGIAVEPTGRTNVDTFEGEVELRLGKKGAEASGPVRLTGSQAMWFDPDQNKLTRSNADAGRFVRSVEGGQSSRILTDHFDTEFAHTYWDGAEVALGSIWDGVMYSAPSGQAADRIDAGISNAGVLTISVTDIGSDGSSDETDPASNKRTDQDDWLLTVAGLYLRVTGDFDVKVRMPVHGTEEYQTHCLGAFTADRRNFVHIDNIAGTPDHVRFRAIDAGGTTVVPGRLAIPQQRWLRLTRTWDMFRAYYGNDGVHWTEVGSGVSRPNLPATLHVGLLAWPFYPDTAFQAQFDNFEIMIPGGTAAERREK